LLINFLKHYNDEIGSISEIDSVLYIDVPAGAPGLAIGIVRMDRLDIWIKIMLVYANLTDRNLLDHKPQDSILPPWKGLLINQILPLLFVCSQLLIEQGKLDLEWINSEN